MNKTYSGEPLTLFHQELLQDKLVSLGHGLSEYCFSNLFLFRNIHQYRVAELPFPYISGITYDGLTSLMPAVSLAKVSAVDLQNALQNFNCYFPIGEADLQYFDPDIYAFSLNRDDSDYVYSVKKLQHYGGRKLAAKKNLLKQFLALYSPVNRPLAADTTRDAVFVLNSWLLDVGKEIEKTDYEPCLEALQKISILNLFGFVYYSRDIPLGFLIAKEIVPGMCVIHFAKGKRGAKGIFQYMFHHFANTLFERFDWINFEQDLGKPNFRKTKQSYQPDKLLKKYRVSYRNR